MALIAVLSTTPVALAQNPIQWKTGGRQAITLAARQQLPLMFYVTGSKDDTNSDLSDAQQRSFSDPLVVGIARERFIPVLLSRTSVNMPILEELKLPTSHGLYVALMAPDGELLDQVGMSDVANARTLAIRMTGAFRTFRDKFFDANIRPVLEDSSKKFQDLRPAFKQIKRMVILSADQSIVDLLDRPDLNLVARKEVLNLLAVLSTRSSVETLVTAAIEDRQAAMILSRAEIGAVEHLLRYLGDNDAERHNVAYQAIAKISKLAKPKAPGFWKGSNEKAQSDEIARVEARARDVLARWQETVGNYR
jgi:hypothetical protein